MRTGTIPLRRKSRKGSRPIKRGPRRFRRAVRRGVTAMEYLVMISFILVVVIITVQHLGSMTASLMKKDADATSVTGKVPP